MGELKLFRIFLASRGWNRLLLLLIVVTLKNMLDASSSELQNLITRLMMARYPNFYLL